MAGTLDFRWDPLELAADQTYSTTIRVEITRWWEHEAPGQVSVSVRQSGQDVLPGNPILVQRGKAIYPLTGLQPKHHYLVVVTGGGRSVENMIRVPELLEPKRPEQEALELEQVQLKRAQVSSEHRKLAAQEKKLTADEKKTSALKAKTERIKAEQELKEAERKGIPNPTDLAIDYFGGNGKYKFFITVLSREKPEGIGIGVPGVAVTIFDRHTGQSWGTKTGADGAVIFEVPEFTEREKNITVFARGMEPQFHKLLGPRIPVRS